MLGETDEWAHERRYDQYLDSAWRGDRFLRHLWEAAQADPDYRGKTALLVTTDHGRGAARRDWPHHGKDVPAAERIWMAALGPDDAGARGARRHHGDPVAARGLGRGSPGSRLPHRRPEGRAASARPRSLIGLGPPARLAQGFFFFGVGVRSTSALNWSKSREGNPAEFVSRQSCIPGRPSRAS